LKDVNTIEVRKWMLERGMPQKVVAARCNVTQPMVSMVINNYARSAKVLRALRDLGCPPELLGLGDKGASS
jgi:predicted XRE-type DNA-binding protein